MDRLVRVYHPALERHYPEAMVTVHEIGYECWSYSGGMVRMRSNFPGWACSVVVLKVVVNRPVTTISDGLQLLVIRTPAVFTLVRLIRRRHLHRTLSVCTQAHKARDEPSRSLDDTLTDCQGCRAVVSISPDRMAVVTSNRV